MFLTDWVNWPWRSLNLTFKTLVCSWVEAESDLKPSLKTRLWNREIDFYKMERQNFKVCHALGSRPSDYYAGTLFLRIEPWSCKVVWTLIFWFLLFPNLQDTKMEPHQVMIFTRFHEDWIKIVDILLMVNSCACLFFLLRLQYG